MFFYVAHTSRFLAFPLVSSLGMFMFCTTAVRLQNSSVNLDAFCFGFVSTKQTPALKHHCNQKGFVCSSLLPVSKPRGQPYRPLLFRDLFPRTEFCRNTGCKSNDPNSPGTFGLFISDVTRSSSRVSNGLFNVFKLCKEVISPADWEDSEVFIYLGFRVNCLQSFQFKHNARLENISLNSSQHCGHYCALNCALFAGFFWEFLHVLLFKRIKY